MRWWCQSPSSFLPANTTKQAARRHLDNIGQHMISPSHLREAVRQGYVRAKDSPVTAFVFISLSSNTVLEHKAVTFQFPDWALKEGGSWKEMSVGGGWLADLQPFLLPLHFPFGSCLFPRPLQEKSWAAFVFVILRNSWGTEGQVGTGGVYLVPCPSLGDALFASQETLCLPHAWRWANSPMSRTQNGIFRKARHSCPLKLPSCFPSVCTAVWVLSMCALWMEVSSSGKSHKKEVTSPTGRHNCSFLLG